MALNTFKLGSPLKLQVAASDPGSAENGTMYYNSTSQLFKVFENSAWQNLASRAYTDSVAAGFSAKLSVRAATTAALPAVTYNNGASGVGATLTADANGALASQDGYALAINERLLVKNQADGLQNGAYTVTALGDGSNPFVLTRATDYDGDPANEIKGGDFFFVEHGTLWEATAFILTSPEVVVLGTDPLVFTQNQGRTTLQVAYAGGQTITTSGGNAVIIAGSESLKVSATLGLDMTDKKITTTTTGQGLFLAPNGGGALVAESTTATVGNARGVHAVDLQLSRSNAANVASGDHATIGGGQDNQATAGSATIGGGQDNQATAGYATIGGGHLNQAIGVHATVGGGENNQAKDDHATIGGGRSNIAYGVHATVGGGGSNRANAYAATVGGGQDNHADAGFSAIGGGDSNVANSDYATIGGGTSNTTGALAFWATVGGGQNNQAYGEHATIGGGNGNQANAPYTTVGGGNGNQAAGESATIPGGKYNRTDADGVTAMGFGAWANVAHDLVIGNNPAVGSLPTTAENVHFRVAGDTSDVHIGRLTDQSAVAGAANKLYLHTILASNQSRAVSIKAPNTLAASYDLILPADDGTASQFLQTDGSGVLSWATVAAPTLQSVYDADVDGGDATITTNATDGSLVIAGTESFSVTATGGVSITNALTLSNKTAGSVLFASTAGLVQQDNANLFWDDTNNRLGIGYAVPATSLHVVDTAASSSTVARGLIIDQVSVGGLDNGAPQINLRKAHGTPGSPTTVVNNDSLGNLQFQGHDGTAYTVGATSAARIGGGATENWTALAVAEVTKFTFSQAGSFYDVVGTAKALQLFNSPAVGHYFWFNVTDGANTQTSPSLALIGTAHPVNILSTDTDAQVAGKFFTEVASVVAAFTATNGVSTEVVVTNVTAGSAPDAIALGTAAAVLVQTQGVGGHGTQLTFTTTANKTTTPAVRLTIANNGSLSQSVDTTIPRTSNITGALFVCNATSLIGGPSKTGVQVIASGAWGVGLGGNLTGIGSNVSGADTNTGIQCVAGTTGVVTTTLNVGGIFTASGAVPLAKGVLATAIGSGALNIGLEASASGATANYAAIFTAGSVGVGNSAPVELFSVGSTSQFQIDANGNILKINDVVTSFPASQGAASTYLQNDGAGVLTWVSVPAPTLQSVYDADVDGGDATITTTATDGSLVIAGTEALKVTATGGLESNILFLKDSSAYSKEFYKNGLALTASTTAVLAGLTFAHATYGGQVVEYRIKEATTGAMRVGSLLVSTDGTLASVADTFSETADVGVTWTAAVSGADVELSYTTTANAKTLHANIKQFLAA